MKRFLVIALIINTLTAQAAQPEKWGLPDLDILIPAVNSLCQDQRNSALIAMGLRSEGRSKEEILALVPNDSPTFRLRSVEAMRENIEDVFLYPMISRYAYVVFRSEVCMREVLEARRFARFSTASTLVETCQKNHGTEKSGDLYQCVRRAVRSLPGI